MKVHFTLAMCFLSFLSYSQKCKYDFEKKDPFTGKLQKVLQLN